MILSARRNPMFGFAAAALILTGVGALVVFTALRFIEDSRWVAHTSAVLTAVDYIAALERAAIAAQRGYLITGEGSLRTSFWEKKAEIPRHVNQLGALVQSRPVLAQLAKLKPKLIRRLSLATKTVDLYDRQGLPAAQRYIQTNGSLLLDQEIEVLVAAMQDEEIRLLDTRRTASERSAGWLLAAAIGGIPLSLIMLAVVYRALLRENAERQKSEQLALESATSFKKISRDMAAMSKYGGMLQGCEAVAELLSVTRQSLATIVPHLAGTVYLIRASQDRAEAALQWGQHILLSDALPLPLACWAMRRSQPFFCDDIHADISCAHVENPPAGTVAATACIPISAQGVIMGWVYLSGPGRGPLAGVELALQAAEQFSLALANLRLQDELRHQSIRDPLTGLFNRRYLEESLAREISRCQRRKLPLVVLMLDLDNFKSFNDHHGHPGGDALLSAFGRLLEANCRSEDIACRFGGEEFTLILPDVERDIGLQRAKAILSATTQLMVAHNGVNLERITTSIGMALLPEHGTTGSSLLEAADRALYQAKADGRNRVCVAVPRSPASSA